MLGIIRMEILASLQPDRSLKKMAWHKASFQGPIPLSAQMTFAIFMTNLLHSNETKRVLKNATKAHDGITNTFKKDWHVKLHLTLGPFSIS